MVEYLKSRITNQSQLQEIVNVFEQACQEYGSNDMILFETGTFSFTGSPLFYFSLVRQFSNEEDEFYQIHVDVLYESNQENKVFSETVWNEEISENIFDYIRNSQSYLSVKSSEIIKVDIYMDET